MFPYTSPAPGRPRPPPSRDCQTSDYASHDRPPWWRASARARLQRRLSGSNLSGHQTPKRAPGDLLQLPITQPAAIAQNRRPNHRPFNSRSQIKPGSPSHPPKPPRGRPQLLRQDIGSFGQVNNAGFRDKPAVRRNCMDFTLTPKADIKVMSDLRDLCFEHLESHIWKN